MEAQTKKVSVIIPVYNAEKYIRKTLDSVLAQSFRNREILLVENGCEDQSTEILREYKEKYDEIRLISCADRGAGAARNTGLEQAAGEYILFVDADDYLPDTGILEKYVKAGIPDTQSLFQHFRQQVICLIMLCILMNVYGQLI